MREFRLIFAQCDSTGIIRPDIADNLGARMVAIFGGFTRISGHGGYIMADDRLVTERVYIFDVATSKAAADILAFARMAAAEIKRTMEQESVYFRNVDSNVILL